MRPIMLTAAVIVAPLVAAAQDDVTEETVERINELLSEMQCQMDPGDIEPTEAGGYELDDVMCAEGQFDIELDDSFEVTERRAE